ncbi:19199_t:CDS:2, partial [Racocetra fulgida]
MTKSDKVLTPEYLDWYAKLSGLPSVLTGKIRSNLYKKYKKETGHEPWQLPKAVISTPPKPKTSDFKPTTYEAKPDPELIIKSVLEHFTYLKFRNSFRGIDNYSFASPQPWSSPCPICNGRHGNYGLHGEWYRENGMVEFYLPFLFLLLLRELGVLWLGLGLGGVIVISRGSGGVIGYG